jgi:hypothetical protein
MAVVVEEHRHTKGQKWIGDPSGRRWLKRSIATANGSEKTLNLVLPT